MPQSQQAQPPVVPVPLLGRKRASLFADTAGVFDKLLSLDQLRDLYRKASQTDGFHYNLLAELEVSSCVDDADLARIPGTGALVAVANHPFGMLEGSLLGTVLPKVRQDYKIMTNQLLACMPELASHCIFVDPFQNKSSAVRNGRALKEAISWLRGGHMLVIFPAGEVSHWNLRNKAVEDPEWNTTVARLIRITRSAALPIFFKGANSVPFHVLGMVHPRLRTARLPHELFNKRGKSVEIRVGSVIPFEAVADIPDDTDATRYLRWRTYLLGKRGETGLRVVRPEKPLEAIAQEASNDALLADLRGLRPEQCLEDSREYAVYLAETAQLPNLLPELGRLREMTFRLVGEGTGRARDLDSFDAYYDHLLLWNKTKQELVGAYRIGNAPHILARYGTKGLYTSTLFHYDAAFFRSIGPALELGRSFVRPEYQKKYAPLLLLWKGLGRHVARHPETPVLFGAVSISNDYNPVSRHLVARFLEEQQANEELAKLVRPRRPFLRGAKRNVDDQAIRSFFRDLDSLSAVIADMETDGKGVPVLLKQYLKLGGKLLGFNVDPQFADALDGLVLVDLRKTERDILDRYMGKEGATAFLAGATGQAVPLSA
ncbi:MAG: putative hemolysin [Bryobacterales bacterium]|nr:putative hemolysin [Bryobacterales bacterium]